MKRIIIALLLTTGCGRPSSTSSTNDVIGGDQLCRKVQGTAWHHGSGALKDLKGVEVECAGDYFFAVRHRNSSFSVDLPRHQLLLLTLDGDHVSFNGVAVGEIPDGVWNNPNWDELCSGRYKDVCDLYVEPTVKLVLKNQAPPQP